MACSAHIVSSGVTCDFRSNSIYLSLNESDLVKAKPQPIVLVNIPSSICYRQKSIDSRVDWWSDPVKMTRPKEDFLRSKPARISIYSLEKSNFVGRKVPLSGGTINWSACARCGAAVLVLFVSMRSSKNVRYKYNKIKRIEFGSVAQRSWISNWNDHRNKSTTQVSEWKCSASSGSPGFCSGCHIQIGL